MSPTLERLINDKKVEYTCISKNHCGNCERSCEWRDKLICFNKQVFQGPESFYKPRCQCEVCTDLWTKGGQRFQQQLSEIEKLIRQLKGNLTL